MSLRGEAVIAIWQDLVPEAKQDFYEWHNRQHIPERLAIPGFLRARRLIAVEGGPEFFTLYELEKGEAAAGKVYLDRLNAPTEWTRRIMPSFRNMARSACIVAYSWGTGDGGYMMTLRSARPAQRDESTLDELCTVHLPPLAELAGISGVHLCLADGSSSNIQTFEKTFRTAPDLMPPCVAMIEGTSPEHVRSAGDVLAAVIQRMTGDGPEVAIYRLEHSAANSDTGVARVRKVPVLQHAPG